MPTYNYICENCKYSFEKFQKMSAGTLRKCPECKRFKLKRLIGAGSGVIFKGEGFYCNDCKKTEPVKTEKVPKQWKKGPANLKDKK